MPSPENLLHLAALAAGLSIAYVGLDKVHPADRKLDGEIDFACKNWAELVCELELEKEVDEEGYLNEIDNVNAMYLLCFIAEKGGQKPKFRIREKWRPKVLYLLRLYYFPLFRYFRYRVDFWFVTIFALISTAILLMMSASELYDIEIASKVWFLKVVFWYFTVNIVFIFFTAFCSARLFSIRKTCARFEDEIRLRTKRFSSSSMEKITRVLTAAARRL